MEKINLNKVTYKAVKGVSFTLIWVGFLVLIASAIFFIMSYVGNDVDSFDYFTISISFIKIFVFFELAGGFLMYICNHIKGQF
jgi:hypothetical protein